MSTLPAVAADFVAAAEADLGRPDAGQLSDEALAAVLTAATRLYAARTEARGAFPAPIDRERATATDVVVTACEMIRAVDLNMFDVSMWFGRPRAASDRRV